MPSKIALLGLLFPLPALSISGYAALTVEQKSRLAAHEQVVITEEREGAHYPDLWVLQLSDASVEEVMAVFTDYSIRKEYQPYILDTRVTEGADTAHAVVDWEISVPLLGRSHAQYRHDLTHADGILQLRCESILPPVGMESEVNSLSVQRIPQAEGTGNRAATLLTFATRIRARWWTTLGYSRASYLSAYQSTLDALVKRVELERSKHRAGLAARVERLRKVLGEKRE